LTSDIDVVDEVDRPPLRTQRIECYRLIGSGEAIAPQQGMESLGSSRPRTFGRSHGTSTARLGGQWSRREPMKCLIDGNCTSADEPQPSRLTFSEILTSLRFAANSIPAFGLAGQSSHLFGSLDDASDAPTKAPPAPTEL